MTDHQTVAAWMLDFAAIVTVLSTHAQWLPELAALLAAIWYCIEIYDWWRRP